MYTTDKRTARRIRADIRRSQNSITLVPNAESGLWHAVYAGPDAPRIAKAFGVSANHIEVPTAFTLAMSASDVVAEIKQRNPGYAVSACLK